MSDNNGIQLLKNIANKFKAFLFSKDALNFLLFLLLSTAFWFSNTTNQVRDANITIPLRYNALPNDYTITNTPPQEIRLSIRDEGLNLFSYSKRKLVPLNIDLSQIDPTKEDLKLNSEQILSRLSYYLYPTTSIISFTPDSIFVEYEKMNALTLPVKLDASELAQQYILSDSIEIIPDRITAYGSEETLKDLKEVHTEFVDLTQVKDSISLKLHLIPVESVNFSTDEVEVNVKVEMLTEKKVQVPVTFINVPRGLSIRSFPAIVSVSYNIGLSNYSTKDEDIKVIIDYNDIKNNELDKQKLKIVSKSPKIFNLRVMPDEVEYIIEEKRN